MTMRVVIQNTDTARTVKVEIRGLEPAGAQPRVHGVVEIAPKSEKEVWLHSGQDAVLSEV